MNTGPRPRPAKRNTLSLHKSQPQAGPTARSHPVAQAMPTLPPHEHPGEAWPGSEPRPGSMTAQHPDFGPEATPPRG